MTDKLLALAKDLNGANTTDGIPLVATVLEGDVPLLKVEVLDREEFPIYFTLDEDQILCVTYLWKEAEINQERRGELMEAMLTMNLPMPLSSFGKVGDQYLLFGAMAVDSRLEEIQHEIGVLSDNTLNAIEAMAEYLAQYFVLS